MHFVVINALDIIVISSLLTMASAESIVNPIDPSVIDKCHPDFVKVYNKYQGEQSDLNWHRGFWG